MVSEQRILFVCTGNSCRSVMAQHLLQQLVEQAGVSTITAASAGVFAAEGMGATLETQRILRHVGIDCAGHLARVVTHHAVEQADLILVMEEHHRDELLKRFPGAKDKIHLLKTYGLPAGQTEDYPNIPDPIGKPMEVYEVCFETIQAAVARAAKALGVQGT